VLDRGPEVHRDGAQLHLDLDLLDPVGQEHRDPDDQVQAPVAVGLRARDVVLGAQQLDVVLGREHAGDLVHVGDERADHADAGDVVEDVRGGDPVVAEPASADLFLDRLRPLHPARDVLDRVVAVDEVELLAEDPQFRHQLFDGELVHQQESRELPGDGELVGRLPQVLGRRIGGH
jgi:hypothetical protein